MPEIAHMANHDVRSAAGRRTMDVRHETKECA